VRAISHGEKRVLKGTMRGKQASKRWCLAERYHGDSQEACIALRGTATLTYLACYVSQWSLKPDNLYGSTDRDSSFTVNCQRSHR
jgi:hypothetical protein